MTPAQARAATDRALAKHGRLLIRHYTLDGVANRPFVEGEVRGRIKNFEPKPVVNQVQQGGRKAIVSATDYEAHGFPGKLRKGDQIIRGADTLTIEVVDSDTRKLGGVIVAYELKLAG